MKKRYLACIITLCCSVAAIAHADEPAAVAASRETIAESVPNRILVKLDSTSRAPLADARLRLAAVAGRFGIDAIHSWMNPALVRFDPHPMYKPTRRAGELASKLNALERIVEIRFSAPFDPTYVARKVASLPGIDYAEPVFRRHLSFTPNDPLFPQQWQYLTQVRAMQAWDVARADSSVIIGIVDTGIDMTHPDLKDAIWRNPGEQGRDLAGRDKRTNGVDDDGNGLVDDWIGYDFGGMTGDNPDNDPKPAYGHGTHVAGIAGASGNNAVGVIGVGFGAKLMAVKISNDAPDNPSLPGGFQGIFYAAKMGARIINCSWGGPGKSQAEQEVIDAVTQMGTLIVAAAGNESRSIPSYPASYRNVFSVASVTQADLRSSFSNYNPSVDISAPGEAIFSTFPVAINGSGYQVEAGTSMASPIVAGAAAIVLSKYPDLGPEQISAVLRANADNIDQGNPNYASLLGSGRINVERAVTVGPDAVAADIIGYRIVESNPDKVIEPGETVELRVQIENLLRASSDLSLELTAINPADASILTPRDEFGVVGSGDTRESHPGIFRFVLPANAPIDYRLPLLLRLREGDRTIGEQRIEILVNPNFGTTSKNRLAVTFTGHGRVGYDDFPYNELGDGFRVGSSANILAEGGMLIGVSPTRLADVVRSADESQTQNQWLATAEPYRVRYDPDRRVEIGTARFNDDHLIDLQRVGVDIRLKTYEYTGPDQENQILATYTIRNTSGARLDSLFAAFYYDWDIGPSGADNKTDFDPENRFGYTSNVIDPTLPVVGVMLVSDEPMNFYAMDNNDAPLAGGFSQREKWDVISSGVHHEVSRVGDCSMAVGAGPITLEAGADTTLVFALMAAPNLTELRAGAETARRMAADLGTRLGGPIPLPKEMRLLELGPNPFEDRTNIEFWMPDEGHARVAVFDAIGRRVATLVEGDFRRGIHSVTFVPPTGDGNGVYFVQFDAFGETQVQKLVRLIP